MNESKAMEQLLFALGRGKRQAQIYFVLMVAAFILADAFILLDHVWWSFAVFGCALVLAFATALQYWWIFCILEQQLRYQTSSLAFLLSLQNGKPIVADEEPS